MTPPPFRPLPVRPASVLLLLAAAHAAAGALVWSPEGMPGGGGTWRAGVPQWRDGESIAVFQTGADLVFPEPGAIVSVAGDFLAGAAEFSAPGYILILDNAAGGRLSLSGLTGPGRPMFAFRGGISAGANAYPPASTVRAAGLELRPLGPLRLAVDLVALDSGSPVLGVTGGGPVEFAGTWQSDTGSIFSWLRLDEGGHLVLGADADMRFIKDAYYTLQLWVTGDGSGTLELADGFVADRTEGGTIPRGIGSIRMGAGTLISRQSANLPLGYRPQPNGPPQTNGHLVFEHMHGTRWIVTGVDQVYPGAVWIYRNVEVRTERDLMHIGVSESAPDYLARNGWSVLAPSTVRKTGPGALVLAGEQSYASGSVFDVAEGRLVLRSDPAAGAPLDGPATGARLTVLVAPGAALEWATDGGIESLILGGDLQLAGVLRIAAGGFAQFEHTSRTGLMLGDTAAGGRIAAAGVVLLGGVLAVRRDPGHHPAPGAAWLVCEAEEILGEWTLEDRTGLGLRLERSDGSLRLVATRAAPDLPGEVWLEDAFEEPRPHWRDLSTVPRWGFPAGQGTAFEHVAGVVRLVRAGPRSTVGYTGYSLADGLKTFTALDHRFSRPVAHARSELTIDFRLRWPAVAQGQGEEGRFLVLLNHSYPEGGLDLTPEGAPGSKIADFSAAWWARPAYHVRLRNSAASSSFLQYGGGMDARGEYEAGAGWWLPGFVSGAGGVAPGHGDDFPANSWTRTRGGMAGAAFTAFRYRVLPDRQELWRDDDGDGFLSDNELKAVMPLPPESTAPLYHYFEQFEGLRLFWNGGSNANPDTGQVELDWLRVTVQENLSPKADAGPDSEARVRVNGRAPVRLDGGATTDPEGDPLLFVWSLGAEILSVSRHPVAHVLLPPGEHSVELLVLDTAGNHATATCRVTVGEGKLRPVANAGPEQSVQAANPWFGVATVSGAASTSRNGSIVHYRWTTGADQRVLYEGAAAQAKVALPVGTHILTLTVWDEAGAWSQDTVRVTITPLAPPPPAVAIYRENFSRPQEGGEMGPWEVGWNLMRYDGDPVASIKYDGNAHRSLSWKSSPAAPWLPRINANPTGTEYDAPNAYGHMWMNQMPSLNVSPAEWMLWTEEYAFDQADWQLARITFHSTDGSPERVKVSPAVRIDGRWYLGWDLRVETFYSWWREYTINLGPDGWRLFEPSLFFSIRQAEPVGRLPDGAVTAFGLYFFKDYAWYVNEIDNFTLWARPREPENPYGAWLTRAFPQAFLTDPANAAALAPEADPNGDGWANLWAFATGTDPLDPSGKAAAPRLLWDGETLVLDLPRNPQAHNLAFTVYASADLKAWEAVAAAHERYFDDTGRPRQQWRLEPPDRTAGARFFTVVPRFSERGDAARLTSRRRLPRCRPQFPWPPLHSKSSPTRAPPRFIPSVPTSPPTRPSNSWPPRTSARSSSWNRGTSSASSRSAITPGGSCCAGRPRATRRCSRP